MKVNKWTLALAAVGVVTLTSAAHAEDTPNFLQTAVASTTISGYVDTSAQWNFGTGNANNPPYKFGGPSKADSFSLNVVQLSLDKPLDESDWASGYKVDLWMGPDANTLGTQFSGTSGDFAIRQAYVALRAPLGNGLNFKVGVFDSIIGYETLESGNNANFTHSYGFTIEPTTQTGILATYDFCENFSAAFGVANTVGPVINSTAQQGSTGVTSGIFQQYNLPPAGAPGENAYAESYKTYMGSIALVAPKECDWFSGSTLYAGAMNGYNNSILGSGLGAPQLNTYVGATINTPVTGLRFGAAWDWAHVDAPVPGGQLQNDIWTVAGYATYQATEKLTFAGRVEYVDGNNNTPGFQRVQVMDATATVQYELWKNVISRVEFRWDGSVNGQDYFGGTTGGDFTRENAFMLAAQFIYKF